MWAGSSSTSCPSPWPAPSGGESTSSPPSGEIRSRCCPPRCPRPSGAATPTRLERPKSRSGGASAGPDHGRPVATLTVCACAGTDCVPWGGGEMSGEPGASVTVSEVTEMTPDLVEAFARLVPQLSSSSPAPDRAELAQIVDSPASVLLVARDPEGTIVGSLTLALFRVPTGVRAWIED